MWKAKLTCGKCGCINYPFDIREAQPGKEGLADWQRELSNTAFKVHKMYFPECENSDDKFITNGLSLVRFQSISVDTNKAGVKSEYPCTGLMCTNPNSDGGCECEGCRKNRLIHGTETTIRKDSDAKPEL